MTARNQAIYGSLRKEWKSTQIRHSQPTPKTSPKTISWTIFKCWPPGDLTYTCTSILYQPSSSSTLMNNLFFSCATQAMKCCLECYLCFWLTLYINVYDLYKHLVVNQLVFTCYLLQNSNTWEMSLKYGIFFLMLSRKCCAYNSSLFSVLLQCTCQIDIPWRFKGITWTQF